MENIEESTEIVSSVVFFDHFEQRNAMKRNGLPTTIMQIMSFGIKIRKRKQSDVLGFDSFVINITTNPS